MHVAGLIMASCLFSMLIVPSPAIAQQVPGKASPAMENQAIAFPKASAYEGSKLTYKVTQLPDKTYGYDILADGRLMIRQTSIPAMPGTEGFKTKRSAESVAALVIEKIKKGQMPPTVEIDEMKKLKAIP